jgi:EAL domain-containing protein (putative c-di-GMP-specific phosphodiesterase class I)
MVGGHLFRNGLPADALTLEITEDVLMADPDKAQAVLHRLRQMGVWLSIDDYGTGYSSLGYLRELPVHEVKLDRSFVSDIASDRRSAAIVQSTINLSKALSMQLVAEGIEDAVTQSLLSEWGCDVAQGYHVARPMSAELLRPWLRARTDMAQAQRAAALPQIIALSR